MLVKSFVFGSASPALHQHKVTFTARVEILLHALIRKSVPASLCSAEQ